MTKSIVLFALMLAGCAPALPHGRARHPNTDMPGAWSARAVEAHSSAEVEWRRFFTDPKLDALIDLALQNNQELNIVSQEIYIAQNEIQARKGELLPRLGVSAGVGVEKVSHNSSQGRADEANGVAEHLPDFGIGLTVSWEIDIWGKLRNATKAAVLRYLASQEGRKFAVTLLVGELARSYYELLALDTQLSIVEQNIAIQQNALEVVRLQKQAAKVTELAVQRFEAEVLKNQSRQFAIRQQVVETENRINFLVGRFPQHVDRSSDRFLDLQPPLVHAGHPEQLLDNRPDVKRAQLELIATDFDFRSAKAAFYPTLGLNANLGYQAFDFLKLVATPASLIYSVAADLFAPLLNRRALSAAYFSANARQKQAVWSYERAILNGFIEVAKQLAMIDNLEKSYALQLQQVDKLTRSIDISSMLFAAARADYMEVLMTRRDALEAQIDLVENKKQQLEAAVALYQDLGGGWR
jgi:multidrug efflux system outer membrane protein